MANGTATGSILAVVLAAIVGLGRRQEAELCKRAASA